MNLEDLPIEMQQQIAMQKNMDDNRNASVRQLEEDRAKLETLRMAKDIVMENHRSTPPGTIITAEDVLTITEKLRASLV
jgi:hypothetical protein